LFTLTPKYLPLLIDKEIVLGAGISGLAAASLLAQAGHEVKVIERNEWLAGRVGV